MKSSALSKKISTKKKPKNTPMHAAKGLVIVITGNGKGKTTAAFGQALRAIGQGFKVFVVQFMKGRKYGEFKATKKYLPDITILLAGLDSFVMRNNPAAIDIALAQKNESKFLLVISISLHFVVIFP